MAHDKSSRQIQGNILESIRTIVKSELSRINTTNSLIGVVIEDPKNYRVKVKVNEDILVATVPEERHHWIQKDDVVIIQDLYNDKQKLIITGKTGHTSGLPQLVFSDSRNPEHYVSGVDGVFDENGNLLNYATVTTDAFGNKPSEDIGGGDEPTQPVDPTPTPSIEVEYSFTNVSTWYINHTFTKNYPNVIIVDNENRAIIGEVIYVDGNNIKIMFSRPVSGKAILS